MTDYAKAWSLDGKVALMTGGARGLGGETAKALAQAGARVMVTDVLVEEGQQIVKEINDAGGKAAFLRQDVTDEGQWEQVVEKTVATFGGLDILVNNAGIEFMAFVTDCTVENFRRMLDVNVTGVFLGIKHAVRAMAPGGRAGRGGSIINLSSIAGLAGFDGLSAYCASKGAVRLLTKSTAVECGHRQQNVRINSVHPGVIWTKMADNLLIHTAELGIAPDYATAEAAYKAAHPLGHFGEPSDIANVILFLASDASKFVTGAEFAVDGGYTAT